MDPEKTEIFRQIIEFCHNRLQDDKEVYDYLTKTRKLSDATIRKFALGAFPKNLYHASKYLDAWSLKLTGVVQTVEDQDYSKFIYNRVIIPVYDAHGSPLGIMGRALMDDNARETLKIHKYDNTRFPKGSCLFGLNVAKEAIRHADEAIVVEGNFDVISAHQYGQCNVVATSGSWLTNNQAYLLARYTKNVKLMFDNDKEGKNAAKRTLAKAPTKGLSMVEQAVPEPFKDPDEYYRSLG